MNLFPWLIAISESSKQEAKLMSIEAREADVKLLRSTVNSLREELSNKRRSQNSATRIEKECFFCSEMMSERALVCPLCKNIQPDSARKAIVLEKEILDKISK